MKNRPFRIATAGLVCALAMSAQISVQPAQARTGDTQLRPPAGGPKDKEIIDNLKLAYRWGYPLLAMAINNTEFYGPTLNAFYNMKTAADDKSQNDRAAGPTAAVMTQVNGWTLIVMARQMWSFAGSDDVPNVSPFYINPGVGYSFKSGAGVGGNLEISGDWNNLATQVFLNLTGSMVSKFGNQPVSFFIGPRIPLTSETIGAWGLRAGFTLIFRQ